MASIYKPTNAMDTGVNAIESVNKLLITLPRISLAVFRCITLVM